MDINQAIKLSKQLKKPNFPEIKVLTVGKEGCVLCISALLVTKAILEYLEQFAKGNKLTLVFEHEYWMLVEQST